VGSPYNPDLSPQGRDDIGKIKEWERGFRERGCCFFLRFQKKIGSRSAWEKNQKKAQFRPLEAISACPEE